MIALVNYTGLHGRPTARMAQATENDVLVGLPQPVFSPTASAQTAVRCQMCNIIQKCVVFETHRPICL